MKCLACNKENGFFRWWLTELDFCKRGINQAKWEIDYCLCHKCIANLNYQELNQILFDYWKSLQSLNQPTDQTESELTMLTESELTMLKFPTEDEYPEGYEWFAYDENGRPCFYKVKPIQREDYWYPESENGGDWENAAVFLPNKFNWNYEDVGNWKETLRQKPTAINQEINHPNYYTWHPAIECVKVTQHFMSNPGQAIQYIWRSCNPVATKGMTKEERIKDLQKAIDFLKFEQERIKAE